MGNLLHYLDRYQSNRLDTDDSSLIRRMASAIKVATETTRTLSATLTASVGRIESVMVRLSRTEASIRPTAPPAKDTVDDMGADTGRARIFQGLGGVTQGAAGIDDIIN